MAHTFEAQEVFDPFVNGVRFFEFRFFPADQMVEGIGRFGYRLSENWFPAFRNEQEKRTKNCTGIQCV